MAAEWDHMRATVTLLYDMNEYIDQLPHREWAQPCSKGAYAPWHLLACSIFTVH